MRLKRLLVTISFLFLLFFCFGSFHSYPAQASVPFENQETFPEQEVLAWLGKTDISKYLPVLNCKTKESVRRFVKRLYQAGALYVGVVVMMEEPSGFRVYLPQDQIKREEIFTVVKEEDNLQDNIVLWFR